MVARLLLASSTCALAAPAQAGETKTYSYDALGRLVASSSSGTVNNGLATAINYDPAGNRSCYTVTGAPTGSASTCTGGGGGGTPPPPPPSSNQPPVTASDRFRIAQCSAVVLDVLENDTDPDGDALSISDVSGAAQQVGRITIDGTHLTWWPTASTGSFNGSYTIADGHGGTATGTFLVQAMVSC